VLVDGDAPHRTEGRRVVVDRPLRDHMSASNGPFLRLFRWHVRC
jgi:hypothetical protein